MKTKKIRLWLFMMTVMLSITCLHLFSQVLELEKTFDIPGKADIGDNAYFTYDQTTGNYFCTFFIKAKAGAVNIEYYKFDKDFNLVNQQKDELSPDQAKQKYPWWNYKGDEYTVKGITADESDDLVLREKETEYKYDWKHQIYSSKTDVLGKLKLRKDDGSKYFHFRNWDSENDPDFIYILCGVKDKSDKYKYCKQFHLLKIDKEMNIAQDQVINFDYPQDVVYPRFVDDKTDYRNAIFDKNIILVFAPMNTNSKSSDPNQTNYTYLNLDEKLSVIDRISLNSPSSCWSIEDKIIDKNGAVYLFGASLKGNQKYYDELKDTKKFDGFQILKLEDHKVGYFNQLSIDQMAMKVVNPPSQKKAQAYEGKKFFITSYTLTTNGDLFIVGQSWQVDAMGTMSNMNSGTIGSKARKIKYSDCFGLGFDNKGELIAQYLYDVKGFMGGGQDFSIFQFLFVGKNPKNVYWLFVQPTYWNVLASVYDYRPSKPFNMGNVTLSDGFFPYTFKCDLISSDIGKVDLSNSTLSDFKNHQVNKKEKKSYYLTPKMPFMQIPDNKLVLIGTQSISGGKKLWFARLSLE